MSHSAVFCFFFSLTLEKSAISPPPGPLGSFTPYKQQPWACPSSCLCYSWIRRYSHSSWPMTLTDSFHWTVVWASVLVLGVILPLLPYSMSHTSGKIVERRTVKQLSRTPRNSVDKDRTWQRPCRETRHLKKLRIASLGFPTFMHRRKTDSYLSFFEAVA